MLTWPPLARRGGLLASATQAGEMTNDQAQMTKEERTNQPLFLLTSTQPCCFLLRVFAASWFISGTCHHWQAAACQCHPSSIGDWKLRIGQWHRLILAAYCLSRSSRSFVLRCDSAEPAGKERGQARRQEPPSQSPGWRRSPPCHGEGLRATPSPCDPADGSSRWDKPTGLYSLPTAYCLLHTAYCPPSTAYRSTPAQGTMRFSRAAMSYFLEQSMGRKTPWLLSVARMISRPCSMV